MNSSDKYENDSLNFLTELNFYFEEVFDFRDLTANIKQLAVYLVNEPQFWIESKIDNTLGSQYKIGNARCSDNYPFQKILFLYRQIGNKSIDEICSKHIPLAKTKRDGLRETNSIVLLQ